MTQGPVAPTPRSKFPPTFWMANVMELFERGAYYDMNSVLAVYLTASRDADGLGIAEQSVGFLQSIVYAATYVLPIAGGALADRYGYRRILLVAFSLMAAGYFGRHDPIFRSCLLISGKIHLPVARKLNNFSPCSLKIKCSGDHPLDLG